MMKSTVATIAALAAVASINAETTYYTKDSKLFVPEDAEGENACEGFSLSTLDNFATYIVKGTEAPADADEAACVTASGADLVALSTEAAECIVTDDADVASVAWGKNAECPQIEGGECVAETTVCTEGTKCTEGDDEKFTCQKEDVEPEATVYYTKDSKLFVPEDAEGENACEGFSLSTLDNFATFIVKDTGAPADADEAACITASGAELVKLTAPATECIVTEDDGDVVAWGKNAECPQVDGGECVVNTTVCAVGSTCKEGADKFTCEKDAPEPVTVVYYTKDSELFVPEGQDADVCKGFTLSTLDDFATFIVEDSDAPADADEDACIAASAKLVKLTAPATECIVADETGEDHVVWGKNAECPQVDGGECVVNTTVCAVGSTCTEGTDNKFTCVKDAPVEVAVVFNPDTAFPTQKPTECDGLTLVSFPEQTPIFKYIVGVAADVEACATAADFEAVTANVKACANVADTDNVSVNTGANASCPHAAGDSCSAPLNVCVEGFECNGATGAQKCNRIFYSPDSELFEGDAAFMTQAEPCADFELVKVLDFATYIDKKDSAAADASQAACVEASAQTLEKLNAAAGECIDLSGATPDVKFGTNEECPQKAGGECSATLSVCEEGYQCTDDVCTEIPEEPVTVPFTAASTLPTGTVAECAGLELKTVQYKDADLYKYINAGQTAIDACVAASAGSLVVLTQAVDADVFSCSNTTTTPPSVNAGASEACTQAQGGECTNATFCDEGLQCLPTQGGGNTCQVPAAPHVDAFRTIYKSHNEDFSTNTAAGAQQQITAALGQARQAVVACQGANSVNVFGWVSNKNLREFTSVLSVSAGCKDAREAFDKELKAQLEVESKDKNRVTLESIKDEELSKYNDCKISSGLWGCPRQAGVPATCESIKCNIGSQCDPEKSSDCGTDLCIPDQSNTPVCSSTTISSAIFAVGAAALAAIALF